MDSTKLRFRDLPAKSKFLGVTLADQGDKAVDVC